MNKLFKKHFMSPQNMGKIKKPSLQSKCKSGFCGDTIELFVVIDENNIIKDVKYNVFGCYAIIAAASILSEWSLGKPLDLVKNIDMRTIETIIGGRCDEGKENCVMVAIKAFQSLK